VSKRRDRPYQAGRSKDWVKVKNRQHHASIGFRKHTAAEAVSPTPAARDRITKRLRSNAVCWPYQFTDAFFWFGEARFASTHRLPVTSPSGSGLSQRYIKPPAAPPINGATQNNQSCDSAQPPTKSAGPVLRAGFTEVLVTWMLIK
jgi:hypothetical protein